jgi:GxxExxY protein
MLTGDALTERIIGLAIDVHRQLGPGLLESVYETCLCFELAQASIPHIRQAPLSVLYKGVQLDSAFRADVLISDEVIVELKSVEHLAPVHEAQLLTYLRMTCYRVGLLMNFNMLRLKDGLRRFVV